MYLPASRLADVFPISIKDQETVFAGAGRLDDVTLGTAEWFHFRNVPEDGPLHYLKEGLPLRTTLLEPNRQLDRNAYEAGLWLGSAIIRRMVHIKLIDGGSLRMPQDPVADPQISELRRQAVGHRFRLQPFFENPKDMIPAIHQQVEYPWYEHNVRFGVNKGLGPDGSPRDDYVVVGLGDMLATCNVLLLGRPPAERVPLAGTDAIRPTTLVG